MLFYHFLIESETDGSVAYCFSTKNHTDYRVYFYPAQHYSAYVANYRFLYQYGFICGITKVEPKAKKIEHFDCAIKETIKRIFIHFMGASGNQVILLYHCDYDDGKQEKRNNLFKLWHREASTRISVYMEDTDIITIDANGQPVDTNYLGFLILQSNPNKEAIQKEFHSVKSDLIREK